MAGSNLFKNSSIENSTIVLSDKAVAGSISAALLSEAAKQSVLQSQLKGIKIQHAEIASPGASTLDVTSAFGFNTIAGVDPEGTSKGITVLLAQAGGTEYNTTTGKVGSAAKAASSLYPITDSNGNPIINPANDRRVWGVVSTPARDTTGPYTLRFFSGEFGSGNELSYTMAQAFVPFKPKIFDLDDLPTFDSGDVVFFDAESLTLTPGSISDTDLSDDVQGKSINVLRDRRIRQLQEPWIPFGLKPTGLAVDGSNLEANFSAGAVYYDDGEYEEISAVSGFAIATEPGAGNSQIFVTVVRGGALVRVDGSSVVHPAVPENPTLNPSDAPVCRVTVLNNAALSLATSEDVRATIESHHGIIEEEVTGVGVFAIPTYRPSRRSQVDGYKPILDVFVDGKRCAYVVSSPANEYQYTYTDFIDSPGPRVQFGGVNSDKTIILRYRVGYDAKEAL